MAQSSWAIVKPRKRFRHTADATAGSGPGPVRIFVRPLLRCVSTLLIAVGVATCSDSPPAPIGRSRGDAARIALEPVFSRSAEDASRRLPDFGIRYDHVRVVLNRAGADTVRDTTIAFAPGQPETTLDLTVDVRASGEVFNVSIDYLSTTGIVFHGHGRARARSPDDRSEQLDPITIEYVGPGANVAHIELSPKTLTLMADQVASFVVEAFDSTGHRVSTVPLSWATSDPAIATITSGGLLRPLGRRGAVTISVVTPTGVSDDATAAVVLPPAQVVVASGAEQTGVVGRPLQAPVVVQVRALDGIGVGGVEVVFAPPSGGSVAPVSAVTDASGLASASLTLGPVAGTQAFTATAAGLSTSIPEMAEPGDPKSIKIVSGDGQTDFVRRTLSPLVVLVADQFGNPVPNATVAWTRTAGTGVLAATKSKTDASGRASMTYTLGSVAGAETVSATIGNPTATVTFTLRALAAGPSRILAVSGDGQTAVVNTQLAAPFVVKVIDDAGSPVAGAVVSWTAVNGSIAATSTTDANGRASATMTLGSQAGSAAATASITNGQRVAFSATAQPGVAAVLAFLTQPSPAAAGEVLSAVSVRLLDASGNQTAATNAVSISLANNSNGAKLAGTLTRNAVLGVATFDDLKVDEAGKGYTLIASSGTMVPVASSPFDVSDGSESRIAILAGDDQHVTVATTTPIAPSVQVMDAQGNPLTGVPVTFAPDQQSGTVTPAGPINTDATGVATLTSWRVGTHAGPQALLVSAPGVQAVWIRATANADGPVKLAITTQPSATSVSGELLARQPVVQIQDQFGNPVAASDVVISVAVSSGTLQGTTSITSDATTGWGAFRDLRIVGTGSVTLSFAAQGMPTVTSNPIAVSSSEPPN